MTRVFIAALAAALAAGGHALAVEPSSGATLGTSPSRIGDALAEDGYAMTRYEHDERRIELTAVKDDRRLEVYVDATTGRVTKVEERTRRGDGPRGGIDAAAIRAGLEAEGYEIRKYERERGDSDVKGVRDGRLWELRLDARDGRVLRVEEDD